jgi:hypothetical protein
MTTGIIPIILQFYISHRKSIKKEKEERKLKELEQDRKINKVIYQNEKLGDIIGIYIANNGSSKETKKIVEKLLKKIKEN